jgi:uncharacterized protein YlxW (UPF0749 family)
MKKPTQQRITSLLAIIVLAVIFCAMIAHCGEKGDTLISVSTSKINAQISQKQAHLQDVQNEITKVDAYRKNLEDERTGTAYQIDALTKLKMEADTTEAKGKK